MDEAHRGWADQLVRWTTTGCVVVVAGIAAVISYKHMFVLVLRYGETSWTAALLPVSVDGMIVASSMSLLADSRSGRRSGLLPWTLLMIGSAASLAANVAAAEPSVVGRVIAAWPSCALIGAYELLMRQVRHAAMGKEPVAPNEGHVRRAAGEAAASFEISSEVTAMNGSAGATHTDSVGGDAPSHEPSYGSPAILGEVSAGSYVPPMRGGEGRKPAADGVQANGAARSDHPPRHRRPASGLRRQAWQWALTNRTPEGELPSGKVIAEQFGRHERWGRLVKQAGVMGRLDRAAS